MAKNYSFILNLAVYPFYLRFSFEESDDQVIKFFKRHRILRDDYQIIKYESEHSPARCIMLEGVGVIRMRSIPKTAADLSSLQHEITHYVMFLLFNQLGMVHNDDTTEAYAYLTAYITYEAYKRLPKFR